MALLTVTYVDFSVLDFIKVSLTYGWLRPGEQQYYLIEKEKWIVLH